VIDFDQAGVLPSSFMSYAIDAHPKKRLPVHIRKTIPLPKSSNLGPLGRATYVLKTVHNAFGMPNFFFFFVDSIAHILFRYPPRQSHRG
jgi:hypothetical protein